MEQSPIDYRDIQGLVRFGHSHLNGATFLLLSVEDPAMARHWLATANIATAEKLSELPKQVLQVAFTSSGLRALGLSDSIISRFSPEFVSGMAGEESRSRRLGDVGKNAPSHWQWGADGAVPDVLVMLYSTAAMLPQWQADITRNLSSSGFRLVAALPTTDLGGVEPFGFADGISQPGLLWDAGDTRSSVQWRYTNSSALGEFLLGYPNEYGKFTDRPLMNAADDPRELLAPAIETGKRDFGRNGTYLVFRQLEQDIAGFWQFLDSQAKGDAQRRKILAEAMVGRRTTGEPLIPITSTPISGIAQTEAKLNQFTYESDAAAIQCPFGAHIRRANPRNADFPIDGDGLFSRLLKVLGFGRNDVRADLLSSVRFHRILRRGREYGSRLDLEDALRSNTPTEERGLHFICLNANICRQFEFIQNAWLMSGKFNGLADEDDPLLGNRQASAGCPVADTFSIPQQAGLPERIRGMPQFITVRGGAYFFLPGLRALRYLAALGK